MKQSSRKNSKKTLTVLLVIAVIAGIVVFKWVTAQSFMIGGVGPRAKGNPKAAVKIVEFIDFQCPACAKGSLFLSKYIEQYPDRLYLQIKYFPLGRAHKHAYQSALYAECAARQNKFWPFHDLLMGRQSEWSRLLDAEPTFNQMAREAGLDIKQLEACRGDQDVMEAIFKEKEEGSALRVQSTPTYIVNGEMVVGLKSLDEQLKKHFHEGN